MDKDWLRDQIIRMQAVEINGVHVLNESQRAILDDVLSLLDSCVCVRKQELRENLRLSKELAAPQNKYAVGYQTAIEELLGEKPTKFLDDPIEWKKIGENQNDKQA